MIPKSIAEVDTKWLSEVVNQEVTGFDVTQIGQGVGIMGDIYRVSLSYAEAGTEPSSVVIKLPSSFEENRSQGVALGMFEAEVKFYNELAGDVAVGLPQVLRADINAGSAEFVIVMEDLSDLVMVEQAVGMSAQQAKAAVEVVAHIHATWWDQVQAERFAWIPTMVGPRIEFVDQLLVQIAPVFAANFAEYLPEGGLELYERFAGNYLAINTTLAQRSPWTLAHQDYRVENLLFGQDRVVVLDWQGIGLGPGAYDLAYILGGSMDTEDRRTHETDLVNAYHQKLVDLGITGYSQEQLWDDYGHAQLMGGLATSMVTGGGMDLSNERGKQLIGTMSARHAQSALDHNGIERLKAIKAGQ